MRGMLLAVGLAVTVGCSSPPDNTGGGGKPTNADALHEVATLLRSYPARGGKGPAKVADLAPYEHGGPLGYAAVKKGDIVVVWGVAMGGEGDAGSADVIAYEKKTPAEGGGVLLLNGDVKQMTAGEFTAAPKAGGKK